jgi:hypothetical protein
MSAKREHKEEKRKSFRFGVLLTAGIHVFLFLLLATSGLKRIYPPPPEMGIIIDYRDITPPEPKPVKVESGKEPRSEKPKPKEEVKLVQRSKAAETGKKASKGAATTMGDKGDVDKYEPKRSKPVDKRALFPSDQNGDSLSPQVASKISQGLSAGHPDGNTETGRVDGEPSARLPGRSVMGSLPTPDYSINKSGKVVVKIMVDQYGKVVNAIPGAFGTTVQDRTLWNAAKDAALKAKFNVSSEAPGVQEGTITYIFKLK